MNATPSAAPPSPPRSSSTKTSFDGKRPPRLKDTQFIFKHGLRHHSYEPEKAPYPLSYDRHVLELESLDNRLVKHLRNSVSFIDTVDGHPEHCLDLGCGTGTWVIDAATEWPNSEFVGFDLVNVQFPLKILPPSIADRITWVHGNFLTTRLPFEDDEFDHIHIQSIAMGVPESKWHFLLEEVNRVLRPGGSVEMIEDDIVFPILPRWFTTPLRARPRRSTSVHFPDGTQRGGYPSRPNTPSQDMPNHDHALLESLYNSVFEHRFINRKPSAVLPSYFIQYFRQVTLSPVLGFPMPPLPPLQPLPAQQNNLTSNYVSVPDAHDIRASTLFPSPPMTNGTRPMSLSFSSSVSATSSDPSSSLFSSSVTRTKSTSFSSAIESLSSSTLGLRDEVKPIDDVNFKTEDVTNSSTTSLTPPPPHRLYMLDNSLAENPMGKDPGGPLFHSDRLQSLNERSTAMHLYRTYQTVLACQEALWEELKDRVRNRKDELKPFGWDDDEDLEELVQNRKKFEKLLDRFKSDMKLRVALWCSLNDLGWPFPPRDPLSKAELIEDERIREAMVEAKTQAPPEDLQLPCRSLRVLIGYKHQS